MSRAGAPAIEVVHGAGPLAIEVVRGVGPAELGYLAAAVTLLGEAWVFVPVLALTFWFVDRDRAGPLFGLLLGTLAVVVAVKVLVGIPRPAVGPVIAAGAAPDPVAPAYEWAIRADGYGFPSGHAAAATVGWGWLALYLRAGPRRLRLGLAATAVVLVCWSRLHLGHHTALDVTGGVAIGVGALAVSRGLATLDRDATTVSFAGGLAGSAIAIALAPSEGPLWIAAGALAGGLVAWRGLPIPREPFPRTATGLGVAGIGLGVVAVATAIPAATLPGIPGRLFTAIALGGSVVAWPWLVDAGRQKIGGT